MFNINAVIEVLPLLLKGFGGVFVVIVLVWLSIAGLGKICK